MDRRRVLVGVESLLAAPIAGCVSAEFAADDDDGQPPEPVVEAVRIPAVDHVEGGVPPVESIDADADLEFAATFENTGDAGVAAISLYLLEATDGDESVLTAGGPARVTRVDFEAGERREVSFDDVSPDGYDVYYLRANVGSVEADVHNEGADGPVEVALTSPNGEATDERRTLELAAGATETVSFDGPFVRAAYDVEASAVDE